MGHSGHVSSRLVLLTRLKFFHGKSGTQKGSGGGMVLCMLE